MMLLEDILID